MDKIFLDYTKNEKFDEDILKDLAIEGEGIEVKANIFLWDETHSKLNINVNHIASKTVSRIKIRAVLKDSAQLDITGNLHIQINGFDSDAYLEAKVLVLGPKTKAFIIPELKIDNKEVKAKHAVVIKKISEDDLFFLESRGINKEKAKDLIIKYFLQSNP